MIIFYIRSIANYAVLPTKMSSINYIHILNILKFITNRHSRGLNSKINVFGNNCIVKLKL